MCWLAALAVAMPAAAHDYWLESRLATQSEHPRLVSRLYLGEALRVEEERPYDPARTLDYSLILPDRVIDLRKTVQRKTTPALNMPLDASAALLRLDRNAAFIEHTPDKFRHYLEHEGQLADFPHALPKKQVRERYLRYLKSLVSDGAANLHSRVTGQRLEIVLLDDPLRVPSGEKVRVRVLFEHEALPNAHLFAYRRDAAGKVSTQALRTDVQGGATFKLTGTGQWLVRSTYIEPCTQACEKVQWDSHWAAFSFRR